MLEFQRSNTTDDVIDDEEFMGMLDELSDQMASSSLGVSQYN